MNTQKPGMGKPSMSSSDLMKATASQNQGQNHRESEQNQGQNQSQQKNLTAAQQHQQELNPNPAITTGMPNAIPSSGQVKETPVALRGTDSNGEYISKEENTHKYQLPSAPTTLQLSTGNKECLEGVYETSDPDEIKELDKMVNSGAISRWYEGPKSKQQIPPTPARQQLDNNDGVIR